MRFISAVALVLAFSAPATSAPERSPAEDKYAACLIGTAAVEMRYVHDSSRALDTAFDVCEPLSVGIDDDEIEGIGDFATLTIEQLDPKTGPAEHL